jgi:hypothetical protein
MGLSTEAIEFLVRELPDDISSVMTVGRQFLYA